jgi:hypothetical protein
MRAARLAPALAILALSFAPPARSAEKPKPRVVLVEADGRDEELSAFLARLESELSDGGKVTFTDGRLAGTTIGSLMTEPDGEAAKAFRAEWPGETWLAVSLSPCEVKVSRIRINDTSPEGYRYERVVENVYVACSVSLRLADSVSGKEGKLLTVTGTANFRRTSGDEEDETSELDGTREAAKKAAKKLAAALKR